MKISTAILKGCKLRPNQCFGQAFVGDTSSCVLGAIADASKIECDSNFK